MSQLTGKTLDYAITAAAGSGFLLFGYGEVYHLLKLLPLTQF